MPVHLFSIRSAWQPDRQTDRHRERERVFFPVSARGAASQGHQVTLLSPWAELLRGCGLRFSQLTCQTTCQTQNQIEHGNAGIHQKVPAPLGTENIPIIRFQSKHALQRNITMPRAGAPLCPPSPSPLQLSICAMVAVKPRCSVRCTILWIRSLTLTCGRRQGVWEEGERGGCGGISGNLADGSNLGG